MLVFFYCLNVIYIIFTCLSVSITYGICLVLLVFNYTKCNSYVDKCIYSETLQHFNVF